jgi:hypothetical protein
VTERENEQAYSQGVDDAKQALVSVARGIIYRRRGNVHGFDGVRFKDDEDE